MVMGGFGWEIIFFLANVLIVAASILVIPISLFFGYAKKVVRFFFISYGLTCIGDFGMLVRTCFHVFSYGGRAKDIIYYFFLTIESVLFFLTIVEIVFICRERAFLSRYYFPLFIFLAVVPWLLVFFTSPWFQSV